MQKTLWVGGLSALVLAAAGGVAFAQQAPARGMRADTDGDGRISQAEFVGQRVQRMTAVDADGDGSVTADERRAGRQARMAARADARFDRLDANDDGSISRAEYDTARQHRHDARAAGHGAGPEHGPRGAGGGHHGMGRQAAGAPVAIADIQARAEQAFARLDSDHDGFITAAEGRAGRQAMREHRRERMTEHRAARQASPSAPASE